MKAFGWIFFLAGGGAGSGKIILQGDSIVLSNTPATENGYMRFESIKLYQE